MNSEINRPCGQINIRGINFDNVSYDEALEMCISCAKTRKSDGSSAILHTPNAEILQLCIDRPEYYEIIGGADIIVPDGIGVIVASKILRTPLRKGKVAGVELADGILRRAAEDGLGVFFYGGKPASGETPSVADLAAEKARAKYPGLKIVGTCDGYVKDDAAVTARIRNSGADILFVCLGAPKQEEFMYKYKGELGTGLCCGFGGTLDIIAGTAKRAPDIFIKLGLEWFYRLLKQPSRFVRMLALPKFLLGTVFFGKRQIKK